MYIIYYNYNHIRGFLSNFYQKNIEYVDFFTEHHYLIMCNQIDVIISKNTATVIIQSEV
jgi:hypothetical protein